MAKIYTVSINGKEEFLVCKITGVRIVNRTTDFYAGIDDTAVANALPGLFKISPRWSNLMKSDDPLTFDLNEFAKLFGITGKLRNECGYGAIIAEHKATNTRIVITTEGV